MNLTFPLLKADDIEVRVGTNKEGSGMSLLLYKTARIDANILDAIVGAENWQKKYYELKGNIYCSLGIRCKHEVENFDSTKRIEEEWVWKDDCGKESQTEAEKGEASDSFKRAGFAWGIGRELYSSPFIWVSAKLGYDKYTKFEVKEIDYDANKEINKLVIVESKTQTIVFSFGSKNKVAEPKIKLSRETLEACANTGTQIENIATYLKKSVYELNDEEVMEQIARKVKRNENRI